MLPPRPRPPGPCSAQLSGVGEGRLSLTQEQQMKTMQKDSMIPAMPTTQVSRRKRMTPKMFCRHGRYTPMKVPMRGACQGGQRQFPLMSTKPTGTRLLPCSSILHVPIFSISIPLPLILIPLPSSHPAAISQPSCLHHLSFKPTPPSSLPDHPSWLIIVFAISSPSVELVLYVHV